MLDVTIFLSILWIFHCNWFKNSWNPHWNSDWRKINAPSSLLIYINLHQFLLGCSQTTLIMCRDKSDITFKLSSIAWSYFIYWLFASNSKLLNFKILYYRTEAVLLAASKGAFKAKEEWEDLHGDELAPGQKAPSRMFYPRQKTKFAQFGTVENRVCKDWTRLRKFFSCIFKFVPSILSFEKTSCRVPSALELILEPQLEIYINAFSNQTLSHN